MTIHTQVKTAVRNVALVALSEYQSIPVIYSHQNGAEPNSTYCTINLLRLEQQGHGSVSSLTNLNKNIKFSAAYEVMIQFSFFGSQSGDACYSLTQRINNSPFVFEELAKNKLGVLRKSQVRFNPQKRETQWIDSYNVDVYFSYILETKQLIDYVDAVVVQDTNGNEFTVPQDFVITP